MVAPVRLYVAVSLDGFLATPDGSVEWLAPFDDQDFGYASFFERVGLLIMGRVSYEQTLAFGDWPYQGKPCYVVTSTPMGEARPDGVAPWTGDVGGLIRRARGHDTGDTWVVGGASTIGLFLRHAAVDQIDMFVMPIWLGRGLPLFPAAPPRLSPSLVRAQKHASGVVQLTYRTRKPLMAGMEIE
ncbi:dihydrofolate reductase family protein [Roseospira navarrensis]|uniref:Dihydrofolate reductase n=1 Tax=Roseospira navarrensis TaxID=140058 RepID=A0A7X2D405_9PROT|nr:dihydrofolate reductase family protein [Roseospira navarrensis]MQX37341.1 dihydrofolate reductase [Roseospira navarrensis]